MAFQHILVPIDFGEASERALDIALDLAARSSGDVMLLHVTSLPPAYYLVYAEGLAYPAGEIAKSAKEQLDGVVDRARKRWPRVDGVVVAGEPADEILEAAKTRRADLIVMGTHGRHGLDRVFLGSVAEKVVRNAPMAVLTTAAKAAAA